MSRAIIGTFVRLIGGFLRWYWKQSAAGMIVATAITLIATNYLLAQLGMPSTDRTEVTTTLGFVLLVMAAAAYFWRALTGTPKKR